MFGLSKVWMWSGLSGASVAAAVIAQDPSSMTDVAIYLAGLGPFWILGACAIGNLERGSVENFSQGAGKQKPLTALLLILCFMGVSGFPLSPTFLGEDLLLHHLTQTHLWMAAVVSAIFVINGIAIARSLVPLHWDRV